MGADSFYTTAEGKNAREAFNQAVSNAQYESGHGGYTGTIAEKHEFVMIDIPAEESEDLLRFVEGLVDDGDPRIDDKWGPAGCIQLKPNKWLFFGLASS